MTNPKTCAHGVPLALKDTCDHCEILWSEQTLEWAEKLVAKHTKRLAFLRMRVASQACGDA